MSTLTADELLSKLPAHVSFPNPEIYFSDNYVVLDFETTVLSKGSALDEDNSIVLSCWTRGPGHARYDEAKDVVSWESEYGLGDLVEDVLSADFIIAHNAKFELQWLARCGVPLDKVVVWDTMIGDYVIGGNRWVFWNLSLEKCAQRWFKAGKVGVISKMYKAGLCSRDIPRSWLLRYCKMDVRLTEKLFKKQIVRMERDAVITATAPGSLLPIMYHRCLLTPVLADLEGAGMRLDADLVRTRYMEVTQRLTELTNELDLVTGGVLLTSSQQLAAYLYQTLGFDEVLEKKGGRWVPARTDKDKPRTDKDTIMRLKPKTKEQSEFLTLFTEHRALSNEKSKYLDKMMECVTSNDVLQASFNQTNTQTHRLSSSGLKYKMQFQNFPRSYKPFFTAAQEGWVIGEADGAQLEFRVAAHLGSDEVALDDIINGVDIHSVTAGVIGCTRQEAKADTFKPLYGGQSGTDKQKEYYAFFKEKYSGVAAAQQRWIDEVLNNKKLVTEWGMRYYWPNTRMESGGYVTNSTAICNYPVQAFATAEIIPASLVIMWHLIRRLGLKMRIVNTVHDSIIVEMPPSEIRTFHELSRLCLIDLTYGYITDLYEIDLIVPLACGVKVADHWSGKTASLYVPEGLEHDEGEVLHKAEESLYEQQCPW